MKICIYSISPKKGGGVITKTMLLIQYLLTAGHSVDWYFPMAKGKLPKYVKNFTQSNKIQTKEIFSIHLLRILDALDPFRQIPEKYDIYQVISGFCLDGMVFRNQRHKYFIWAASTYNSEKEEIYGLEFLNPKKLISYINIGIGKRYEKKYARFAFKVFSNSKITKNKLSTDLGLHINSIKVAYPIIDLEKYIYKPIELRDANEKFILFVGIFSGRKNIDLLIDAFYLVNKNRKDIKLKLVGNTNGYLNQYQHKCETLKIQDYVEFVGEVKDNYKYFSNALVTVLPSKEEGFGMVLAESLATGTPVVATKCGGTEEIIDNGQNGFLVNNKPIEMADAILKIIEDDNLKKSMSKNGRTKIENYFSPESTGNIFIQEYKAFLNTQKQCAIK